MKALVTGFEPFGGDRINASLEAVRRLPDNAGAIEIVTAALPTSYARSLPALEAAIALARPDIVLCVGQAGERAALCLERVAVNVQDAEIPDNDGLRPVDAPIVAGGPAAYLATLPVRAAVAALRAEELPAQLSMSAGTFVCNHVFYGLMHAAAGRRHAFRAGFLHVPRLPQTGRDAPSMALDDIVKGIAIVLEAAGPGTVA
ncbi:MAG: pyroglutamyl-peptidase I [Betaproteobacteria bacterium RIFCSPLOWO2_02_FULL_67_26]|nr:MAG: pyroglutamyl-peptidase I [Betaproteobacteria bacterium RIFCSPLOWO2_02_FULL_67_26]